MSHKVKCNQFNPIDTNDEIVKFIDQWIGLHGVKKLQHTVDEKPKIICQKTKDQVSRYLKLFGPFEYSILSGMIGVLQLAGFKAEPVDVEGPWSIWMIYNKSSENGEPERTATIVLVEGRIILTMPDLEEYTKCIKTHFTPHKITLGPNEKVDMDAEFIKIWGKN